MVLGRAGGLMTPGVGMPPVSRPAGGKMLAQIGPLVALSLFAMATLYYWETADLRGATVSGLGSGPSRRKQQTRRRKDNLPKSIGHARVPVSSLTFPPSKHKNHSTPEEDLQLDTHPHDTANSVARETFDFSGEYCNSDSDSSHCCEERHCRRVMKSTLYSTCCRTPASHVWPLLITSTPRSGTLYVCNVLKSLGLKVANDQGYPLIVDGMVSWIHLFFEPHDRYFGAGTLGGGRFKTILHQVRDPLLSLTSIAYTEEMLTDPDYLRYLQLHVPGMKRTDSRERAAMVFYLHWHRFIDGLHVHRFRLEDMGYDVIRTIFEVAGFDPPSQMEVERAMLQQGKETNARPHRSTLTWEELCGVSTELTEQVWDLALRYGYYQDVETRPCL